MSYSLSVRPCPIVEFARRVQTAYDEAEKAMNDHEQGQAKRMVEFAILMAQEGHVGQEWVACEISGHANADHKARVGRGDSQTSFAVWQTAPPD